jgi:ABC-type metal ion transport system substrate-binding protein
MKVDVFKKLIKEAVREVLREELSQIKPTPIQENKTMSFTTQDVDMVAYRQNLASSMGLTPPQQQSYQKTQTSSTGNPYLDIIAETAANMTPQDLAAMRQYNE